MTQVKLLAVACALAVLGGCGTGYNTNTASAAHPGSDYREQGYYPETGGSN